MKMFARRIKKEGKADEKEQKDADYVIEEFFSAEFVGDAGENIGHQQSHGQNKPDLDKGNGLRSGVLCRNDHGIFSGAQEAVV